MNKAHDAWRSASSYPELCALGAAFLTGDLDHFPGWGAPQTDEETDWVEEVLVGCCQAGFLTVASQRGLPPQSGPDDRPEKRRAFVTGFVDETASRALEDLIGPDLAVVRELEEDLALGLRGEEHFLAIGPEAREAELALFAQNLGPEGMVALERTHWVCVVDLIWGRDDHLWPALAACLGTPYP